MYYWTDPDGHASDAPYVEDLPELPIGWLDLQAPEAEVDWEAAASAAPVEWRAASRHATL